MPGESYPAMKRCGGCQEEKPLDAFNRNASKASGRASRCRVCTSQYSVRRRTEDPGYAKQYREAHREQYAAYSRKWRAAHPGHAAKDWKRALNRVQNHARRAEEGAFTKDEWADLCAKYGNRCLCCGRSDVKLTVDHIVPVKHGGTSWISNIQPLCWPCNRRKGDQTIDYRPGSRAV